MIYTHIRGRGSAYGVSASTTEHCISSAKGFMGLILGKYILIDVYPLKKTQASTKKGDDKDFLRRRTSGQISGMWATQSVRTSKDFRQ